MSANVRFVCDLIAAPGLLRRRDGKPFAGHGVAMRRRIEIEAGEWVDGGLTGLTGRSVTTGTAVNHFHRFTERVVVNRRVRNAAWRDGEVGGERIEHVVSLSNRFGEVCVSPSYDGARPTALAVTTEI